MMFPKNSTEAMVLLSETIFRTNKNIAHQKRRSKGDGEFEGESTSADERDYDHTELRCKAHLKAITALNLADPRKLRQFYRGAEQMLYLGMTPMVPPGLKHHMPDWMAMNPLYEPPKAAKVDPENACCGYDFKNFAQYSSMFWTRGLHQVLAQAVCDWNTFKIDEIIQIWLECCKNCTEHAMAIAIKYTEERYATVYTAVKHRDPTMEPAAFLMFRDNNQLNGIVSKHNRDKVKEPAPGKGGDNAQKPDPSGKGKGAPPPADLSKLSRTDLLALTKHAQLELAKTREKKKGKGGGRKKKGK